MCRTSICEICKKKSWTGCGKHIPSVMDNTEKSHWCDCRHSHIVEGETDLNYPPRAGTGRKRSSSN